MYYFLLFFYYYYLFLLLYYNERRTVQVPNRTEPVGGGVSCALLISLFRDSLLNFNFIMISPFSILLLFLFCVFIVVRGSR